MNEYLAELKAAHLAGFYIPELEMVYFRSESFQTAHALTLDFLF